MSSFFSDDRYLHFSCTSCSSCGSNCLPGVNFNRTFLSSHWRLSQSTPTNLCSAVMFEMYLSGIFLYLTNTAILLLSGSFSSFTSGSWQFTIHCCSWNNSRRRRSLSAKHHGCNWSHLSCDLEKKNSSLGKFSYSSPWETDGWNCYLEHVVWINCCSVC